jgi:DHA3 family multidrug efflux protein-like MFS transporter
MLWGLALLLLGGVVAGTLFNIAIPTLVTVLVPKDRRDRANGMYGTVMGVSFAITSVASGLALGFLGMGWVLIIATLLTVISVIHLLVITIPEKTPTHTGTVKHHSVDVKGTISLITSIPGLFALIFFTTFNNFVGGVFMALMDAYGLSLMTVQSWGLLWGFLSFGFIFGGLYIAKNGLGTNPLRNLFRINIIVWITCIFFTIQPSIPLLAIGCFIWMSLVPFIEATEQTIIQKVVPHERQGRVFGFAHSVEQAASPVTALLIGPLAQFIFIPFMTTGRGVDLIGNWFGVGTGRGIALVFIASGMLGLSVTLIAMRSKAYKLLAKQYLY